ncbi:hypothetical protein FIBSPDRAFT_202772 [Athelia psychrophila]|uniref:Uncharacterized protein n=1 Tax=Athelia psychrophila TaxID=1759441 RepID=A0A165ZHI9_9AGAM|nr:hypothetical protein FIBSPDRAFT_202772 [Fibularhizoctonia sp. CBS 109695]
MNGPRLADAPTNSLHPSGLQHMTAQAQFLFGLDPVILGILSGQCLQTTPRTCLLDQTLAFHRLRLQGRQPPRSKPHHDPHSLDRPES